VMLPEGVRVQQRTMCEYNVSTDSPIAFRGQNGNSVSHGGDSEETVLWDVKT
jgi:hypothetical protein